MTYEGNGITTYEPGGPDDHFLGRDRSDPKTAFYTQLAGNCQPGGGLQVNNLGVPEIFCVTESSSEPIDCPGEAGECNRLWQNAAAAAPSHGAIRFIATGGRSVTYRGRGLTDLAILNDPPWGPGGDAAGDWANAIIYEVEAISGDWLIYRDVNFAGNTGPLYLLRAGTRLPWNTPAFHIKSFRVVPEDGISLFEYPDYYGRMVNTVRSTDHIIFSCGDSALLCAYLEKEDDCNFFGQDCEHPRGFDNKASSVIVTGGEWSMFGNRYSGPAVHQLNRLNAGFGMVGNLDEWQINDNVSSVLATASCSVPAAPTGLSYTTPVVGRPLMTWTTAGGGVDSYKVELTGDNYILRPPPVHTNSFASYVALAAGTYELSVRSIRPASQNCAEAMSPPSEKLTVFVPKVPVALVIEIVSTDVAGLGTGTVTVDEPPASEIGGE